MGRVERRNVSRHESCAYPPVAITTRFNRAMHAPCPAQRDRGRQTGNPTANLSSPVIRGARLTPRVPWSRICALALSAVLPFSSSPSVAGERGYDRVVLVEPVLALMSTEMLSDLVTKSCGSQVSENRSAIIERPLFVFNDQDRQQLRSAILEVAQQRAEKWMHDISIVAQAANGVNSCIYKLGFIDGARATAGGILQLVSKRYGANTVERQ